jgi:signal transduction histidine kinase
MALAVARRSDPTPPPVADAGRTALRLVGSRLWLLYLASVVIAVAVQALPSRPAPGAVSLAVLGLASWRGGTDLRGPLRAGSALRLATAVVVAMTALVVLEPVLGARDAQLLLGFVANGAAIGVALAWGPISGLAATAWVLLAWVVTVRVGHPPVDLLLLAGSLGGGLVGTVASFAVRRGFTVTQRALAAADDAVTARDVAAARWRARRREIRTLHDTVLSSLSLLAQGGEGVDEAALREDCRDRARLLRGAGLAGTAGRTRPGGQADPTRPPAEGRPTVDPFRLLRRRWADRSLVVQVYGPPDVLRLDGVAPPAAQALMGAVEECLENVRRHAAVQVASLIAMRADDEIRCVVMDEGRGFDERDVDGSRLGLSDSVLARVREQGGSARVWSAPGAGTSVALSVPARPPAAEIGW